MRHAVYIILGSNYDANLEAGMKFIRELQDQQYQINVYSIDIYAPSVCKDSNEQIIIS